MKKKGVQLNKATFQIFSHAIASFWARWFKKAFFIFFVILCAIGGAFWYYSLYAYQWSESRQQEYLQSKSERTMLNADAFRDALKRIDERDQEHQASFGSVKSVFETDARKLQKQ